ncbi:hypothetical protein GCM10025762_53280 [Haloechinothrix salitolerans]
MLVATDLPDGAGVAVRRAAQLGAQHDAQVTYSHQIYGRIKRWLRAFERTRTRHTEPYDADGDVDVILYGLGRFGSHLADQLAAQDTAPWRSTSTPSESRPTLATA